MQQAPPALRRWVQAQSRLLVPAAAFITMFGKAIPDGTVMHGLALALGARGMLEVAEVRRTTWLRSRLVRKCYAVCEEQCKNAHLAMQQHTFVLPPFAASPGGASAAGASS